MITTQAATGRRRLGQRLRAGRPPGRRHGVRRHDRVAVLRLHRHPAGQPVTTPAARSRQALGREVLLDVGAVLGLLCILAALAHTFLGVSLLAFRSGSMAPAIETGALALAVERPVADLRPGDVVSVVDPDGVRVTHRLVEATSDGLLLKGDANPAPDGELRGRGDRRRRPVLGAEGRCDARPRLRRLDAPGRRGARRPGPGPGLRAACDGDAPGIAIGTGRVHTGAVAPSLWAWHWSCCSARRSSARWPTGATPPR